MSIHDERRQRRAVTNGHPGREGVLSPVRHGAFALGPARAGGDAGEPTGPDVERLDALASHVRAILELVGEDPHREGLSRTPERVAAMYAELLEGYGQDVETVINDALFDVAYGEEDMVVIADIGFSSLCEHHLLPFGGVAHVGYIPGDKVVGLSKVPRIVDMFARRLQVQERMTNEIADALDQALTPAGVIVVLEGEHSCASLRGVRKAGVNMVTTARRGAFARDRALREEFFALAGR